MGIFRGKLEHHMDISKIFTKNWTLKNTFICAYDAHMKSTI